MNFKKLALFLTFASMTFAVLSGCAASRKVQAANILTKCKLEVVGASYDSVRVDLDKFIGEQPKNSILPNPKAILLIQNIAKGNIPDSLGTLYFAIQVNVKNGSEDTLWLRSAKGTVSFDSLAELPIDFRDSAFAIVPGSSEAELHTHLNIDMNALKILATDTIRVSGDFEFSLSPNGELVHFAVDEKKPVLPEERTAFIDKAKNAVLSTIIDAWSSKLQ
ncbi:MAG: hypothetical protein K6A31_10205 [Fibrobacter sp.]|nr:hypothetical protein [Fibrobacter sp.]